MPSGESTPSARTLDSRWCRSCSLTIGGPSRRRFTEYQKPSGRSPLPPRKPTALRMATSHCPVDRRCSRGLHTIVCLRYLSMGHDETDLTASLAARHRHEGGGCGVTLPPSTSVSYDRSSY